MAAGRIFHWRHGWIPIGATPKKKDDPLANLSNVADQWRSVNQGHLDNLSKKADQWRQVGQHQSLADRLRASRAKNADRDALKLQRLAASRTAHAQADVAKRERHRAAAARELDRKLARLPAANEVGPVGVDFRNMTANQKIRAAEMMYGTGSPQHKEARRRFGG